MPEKSARELGALIALGLVGAVIGVALFVGLSDRCVDTEDDAAAPAAATPPAAGKKEPAVGGNADPAAGGNADPAQAA